MKTFAIILFVVGCFIFIWSAAFTGGFVAFMFFGHDTLAVVCGAIICSGLAFGQVCSIVEDIAALVPTRR
jgi:hypothetical protein